MKKTNTLFILVLLFYSFSLQSQIYINAGGTETTCTGTFYDTGAAAGGYGASENITTTFCSNNGEQISFNFISFGTEADFDHLEIYDGADNAATALHTGQGFSGTVGPGAFTSTGACVTFVFTSDVGVQDIGWAATISCSDPITEYPNLGGTINTCVGTFTDSGTSTGSYSTNEDITTTICSDNGEIISVDFINFSTEALLDVLSIYDGAAVNSPDLIGTYSGSTIPGLISSTGTCLTFNFISDGSLTNTGWNANILCGTNTIINNPGGMINTCGGTFYDSGGLNGDYSNSENIVTTICPDVAGECLRANFTSFALETTWDELEIYDGATANPANLIGMYSGVATPGEIISADASGCLTFKFDSDGGVSQSGWEAELSCLTCGTVFCGGTTPVCSPSIPDVCADACSLTLGSPAACPTGGSFSDVFCLSNIGATGETPYPYLINCEDGNDMPNPSVDVWYSFVATGNLMTINIAGLDNPSLGVYEGSSCGVKIGRGCDNGSGSLSMMVNPTNPGATYFLQISGGDISDVGDFELEIISTQNCTDCLSSSTITMNPPPANGKFGEGETVEFCYTINSWSETSNNWVHSVVPIPGTGWDTNTITPTTLPASCDAPGFWAWYTTITGTNGTANNVGTVGPGFAFESPLGNISGILDENPGNNYGDGGNLTDCPSGVSWTFCWEITAGGCSSDPASNDLSMAVETYGDSETGAYAVVACENDPVVMTQATISCCEDTPTPQNISHKLEAPARCKIKWDAIPGVIRYDVNYRVKGTIPWTRVAANNNKKTLRNLAPNTIYQYIVRASCDGTWNFANASNKRQFNTANIPGATPRLGESDIDVLTVSPNPARESIQVDYMIEGISNAHLLITDMTGKLVLEKELGEVSGGQSEMIDISSINVGYYILVVQSGENRLAKKFVKME